MDAAARQLLEVASIEGKRFHPRIVALALQIDGDDVELAFQELERRHGIIRRVISPRSASQRLEYAFTHGIFRDGVSAQIPEGRRQGLCRRVAEAVVAVFTEHRTVEAHQIACLFEEGGQAEKAAEYFLIAAERSIHGFDDYCGIESASRALRLLLEHTPESVERNRTELRLQVILGILVSATSGFSAPSVRDAYIRAEALCGALGERELLLPSLWGRWVFHLVRAEMAVALERAECMVTIAMATDDAEELAEAYSSLGLTLLFQGKLEASKEAFKNGLNAHGRMTRLPQSMLGRLDPKVTCLSLSARAAHQTGLWNEAIQFGREAVEQGIKRDSPYSIAFAQMFISYTHYLRGEMREAYSVGIKAIELGEAHGLRQVVAWAAISAQRAAGNEEGRRAESIGQVRAVLAELEQVDAKICCPQFIAMLSELMLLNKDGEAALREVERGIAMSESTGNCDYLAELLRLKGQALLTISATPVSRAHSAEVFSQAAAVAHGQGARAQELRILSSIVAVEAGSERDVQCREALRLLLSNTAPDGNVGDTKLAGDILATSPGRSSSAAAFDWWQRLLLRQ